MPIRADLRRFYGREWREVVRPRILARAGGVFSHTGLYLGGARCEQCRVPDHTDVIRAGGWWAIFDLEFWNLRTTDGTKPLIWTPPSGARAQEHGFPRLICRLVRIVITVAHVNHVSGDDRDENLKALCQWCHLSADAFHHHLTRSARKDAARPLLNQLSA